ncbi:MAG: glycosyltransferase [Candidatus Micrarchaeota archaeon]|nr:glycosyltransferase [Candidatus Micrarchaeota archaeon]
MAKIAIFIPAFNEEETIGSVVILAKKYGRVFVVDDGSSDSTAEVAKKAGAHVISHDRNLGYGEALKTIWRKARGISEDVIVVMDGDCQHNPAEIPLLVRPIIEGNADVSAGSRFLGRFIQPPPARKEGVGALNFLASMQAGGKALDYQCGFRAYRKSCLAKITFGNSGYPAGAETLISALQSGLRVVEVPVNVRYYDGKEVPFWRGASLAGNLIEQLAKRKPLLFFGGAGVAMLFLSALLGVFVIERFYGAGVLPTGSAILTVFFGIGGLIMLLIGINLYALEIAIASRKER